MNKISKKLNTYIRLGIIAIGLVLGYRIGQDNTQAMMLVTEEARTNEDENTKEDQLKRISSYEELVKLFKNRGLIVKDKEEYNYIVSELELGAENSMPKKEMLEMIEYDQYEKVSITNLQVEGVDEADIMKNDGRYIYQLVNHNKIAIIDTKDALNVVSIITNLHGILYKQIFLDNDKMIVLGSYYTTNYESSKGERKSFSILQVYDIKDRSKPKLVRQIGTEGDIHTTVRKIDDTVYMITNKWINPIFTDKFDKYDIIPCYFDSLNIEETKLIDVNNIWYEPWTDYMNMTFMTAVPIDGNDPIKVQALLGIESKIYMNQDALYLTRDTSSYREEANTYITKYNIDKQNINYMATENVSGSLLDEFCMDEYEGNFRIAVTNGTKNSSTVHIFDSTLNRIGALEGVQPGEKIYRVWFDGEKGYIETFQHSSPFLVIDLKDPKSPKVLGELKVPSYNQVFYPIGTNLIVDVGRVYSEITYKDNQKKEVVKGFKDEGIKLSLFDVKDPANAKEISNIILDAAGSYSEAESNYQAFTVHKQKQLLTIPVGLGHSKQSRLDNFCGAYVFGIEDGRLVEKAILKTIGDSAVLGNRVCFIGDKLYFLYKNKDGFKINEYELDTFKKTHTITLN